MKKYLGNYMSIYAGICTPISCLLPIVISIVLFNAGSKVLPFVFLSFEVILIINLCRNSAQYYSWGTFEKDEVKIKSWFRKEYLMKYSECTDIGIGFYVHQLVYVHDGPALFYIYFSYDKLSDTDKINLNLTHPSKTFIKMGYNPKFYNYLLSILPPEQADMLKCSYENGLGKIKKEKEQKKSSKVTKK